MIIPEKNNLEKRINSYLPLLVTIVLMQSFVVAQVTSPYSRFGLGYVRSNDFGPSKAMGGLSGTYSSALNLNTINPATYADLSRATFEAGVNADIVNIKSNDSVYRATNGSVNHIAIGLPVKAGKYAIALGLLPYTNINYSFIQRFNNDSVLGPHVNYYSGKGSLYQVFIGNAFKVKGFSAGFNAGFLFGKVEYGKSIIYPDTSLSYSTANTTLMNVKSFVYNAGVMYQTRIFHNNDFPDARNDIFVYVGAYASGGIKLNAKTSNLWQRLDYSTSTGNLIIIDTPAIYKDVQSKITMPYTIGGGVMFGNERFWMVGADFRYTNWSAYNSGLSNDRLGNSWRFGFGAQITPKYDDVKHYFNMMAYRIGFYTARSEVFYNDKQLSESAATFGFGIPFKGAFARLNLTAEIGTRGTSDTRAIRETFYRLTFGFVLNDTWFIKRKYD